MSRDLYLGTRHDLDTPAEGLFIRAFVQLDADIGDVHGVGGHGLVPPGDAGRSLLGRSRRQRLFAQHLIQHQMVQHSLDLHSA